MFLRSLSLINFRNYTSAEVEFSKGINCITGLNGEGKTNLLDAIHYLSFCKSFLNSADNQNIYLDAPFFMIKGEFDLNGEQEIFSCSLKRGERKVFRRGQKEYQKLAEHIGTIPLVLVSPSDSVLVTGGSEERRKFIDSVISQFDRVYLQNLLQYNRILQQRNAYLKKSAEARFIDEEMLAVLDEQLITPAELIHERRKEFLSAFSPVFNDLYHRISGGNEKAELSYDSQLSGKDCSIVLKESRNRDLMLQFSSVGIHKDDLEFSIADMSVKRFASMGQQKSLLLSLKLAEHSFLRSEKKLEPILLLDDIYDRLDENRMMRLIELISEENYGQIFITDTGTERIEKLFKTVKVPVSHFKVSQKEIHTLNKSEYKNA